jgi:hypothetical protein
MKSKISIVIVALFVLLSVFGMTGCDDLLQTASTEDVYSKLDSLISNPDGSTDLDGTVTFVGYTISEPFDFEIEGEDKKYIYQEVCISRNWDDSMFVDVTDLDTKLPEKSYVKITGTVTGSIYGTVDNKQEKVLDFHASKMESFTVSEEEPSTENKLVLEDTGYSGEVEFVGAHYAENTFGKVIVVYMNFTNTKPEGNVKFNGLNNLFDRVELYHGEEFVERKGSTFKPDELDSGALDATSLTAYTPTGKTQLYYMVIAVGEEGNNGDVFFADVFDDEFAHKNSIEMPIAGSLADMK